MKYLVVICIILLIYNFKKDRERNKNTSTQHNPQTQELLDRIDKALDSTDESLYDVNYNSSENIDYKGKYQRRYLLTKNEYIEFKKLKEIAEKQNLIICPKVRLLDIIEPRKGDPKYKTLFYKIQSKHVDFVICDHNLYIKAILELDDNSHNQIERKKRDQFVDEILTDVGYTVIRTRSITENIFDKIKNAHQVW